MMETLEDLHKTLIQRKRPEDVAQMIQELLGDQLAPQEKIILKKASKGSLKNVFFGYTSMMQEFATAIGAEKQIKKAIEIFDLNVKRKIDYNDIDQVKLFIKDISPLINKEFGANNFLGDRLNKHQRKEKGLNISKRRYNKKWRLLKRLEKKLLTYLLTIKKLKKLNFKK